MHLNDLLIEKKFAEFSQARLDQDLLEAKTVAAATSSSTSIPNIEEDGEVDTEDGVEVEEDNPCLEEIASKETDSNNNNLRRGSFMGLPPSYNKSRSRCSGKGRGKYNEKGAPLSTLVPIQDHDSSKEAQENDKSTASQKLLTALRKSRGSKVVCVSKEKEVEEDIWDQFRRTRDTRRDDTSKVHHLPGGVFVGKYHEEVVANILRGGHGGKEDLRKKFEEFVIKK